MTGSRSKDMDHGLHLARNKDHNMEQSKQVYGILMGIEASKDQDRYILRLDNGDQYIALLPDPDSLKALEKRLFDPMLAIVQGSDLLSVIFGKQYNQTIN